MKLSIVTIGWSVFRSLYDAL